MSASDIGIRVSLLAFVVATAGCGGAPSADHSVPTLVKTLKEDKDPNMRYWAAGAIGKLGADAQPAVPDLIAALHDDSKLVQMGAAYALGEIRNADAVPALQEAIKSNEKEVRTAAAAALKMIQAKRKK
jgi:HEAT repeat protein